MKYQELHKKLIIENNGKIKDNIVIKPGINIIAKTQLTEKGKELFNKLNVYSLPDFNSKITYLNFNEKNLEEIVSKIGHYSIYNDTHITFLITGISLEAELELIAHNESKIARLTSSRTKAQINPLFVLPVGIDEELFKKYINEIIKIRKENLKFPETKNDLEVYNQLPFKAVSLTMEMSLKDWFKTMIGRLSKEGVELEVQEIFKVINKKLREEYPNLIPDIEWFYSQNNNKKY